LLRDYEILYIVRPELEEAQLQEAVSTVNKLIENLGGASQKTDVWGRRRLAYEVDHIREGQYVLTDFQIEPVRVPEMEATLKISDAVFRHLIVRKPEARAPRSARGGGEAAPASAVPETVEPATVEPATVEPETVEPETVEPETVEPEAVEPEAATAGRIDDTPEDEEEPAEENTEP
jgi:small subunit ribosomal protein S6